MRVISVIRYNDQPISSADSAQSGSSNSSKVGLNRERRVSCVYWFGVKCRKYDIEATGVDDVVLNTTIKRSSRSSHRLDFYYRS